MLSATEQRRICAVRARTGWGPRLIAALVGHPHSTVHATLRRNGCSRYPAAERGSVVPFEWPCPGDLLQMDTKRFARFPRPGHAVTGDRASTGAQKRERVGYEIAHSIIDDHTRLAYTELHRDEKADTVTRTLAFYALHGIQPKRLQTHNAWTYTKNQQLAQLLDRHQIQHRLIPARTPQRNDKIERYQQTLKREWGLGQRYRSSHHRAQALPHWLDHYNEHRHHSSIANQPPINPFGTSQGTTTRALDYRRYGRPPSAVVPGRRHRNVPQTWAGRTNVLMPERDGPQRSLNR